MPFVTNKEGITVWEAPQPETITENRDLVVKDPAPVEVAKPTNGNGDNLPPGFKSRIKDALDNIIPQYGIQIISNANRNLYSSMVQFLSKAQNSVDIILPVHNSIHVAEPCIQTVLQRTYWPYRLVIVDDASDEKTHEVLESYAAANPEKVSLLTNKKNRGFAATVNRGIRSTNGAYLCLLNSDVLVTDKWLTKMVMALEDSPRNQIVNPATNNTAEIAVSMSEGASYLATNKVFEIYAQRRYPEIMPTGFCFLFRRELIGKIGLFDEGYANYGEETDFWMKVLTRTEGAGYPRYRAVMADDTYVYHERGSSFSGMGEYDHLSLRKRGNSRFHKIWPEYAQWAKAYNVKKSLGPLRSPVPASILNGHSEAPYKICWVVHSVAFCGAMKYIADIANEMCERGIDARVALIKRKKDERVNVLADLRSAPVIFDDPEDFQENFTKKVFDKGLVVSSTAEQARIVKELTDSAPKLRPLLHVQSYEPYMMPEKKQQNAMKAAFKLIPDVISSSAWVTQALEKTGVTPFATFHPGVERKLFYPRGRDNGDERPTLLIPMIKAYPFKGYDRGVEIIREVWNQAQMKNEEVRILVYGTDTIPEAPVVAGLGALSQTRLAKVLGTEVDVFLDPSHIHSYGMPALEALASGVSVVSWDNLGIKQFIKSGVNGKIFKKDAPPKEVAAYILDLMLDENLRKKFTNKNNRDIVLKDHCRRTSVDGFISAIEHRYEIQTSKYRIVCVTPHLRKHGGPTTILHLANGLAAKGHAVSITSLYSDVNPAVMEITELPIDLDPHKIPECDILITNSDNPMNAAFIDLKQAKKKVMLKLSQNARFKHDEEESLKLPWDAIVTSSEWLRKACEEPLPGWNHPAVKATRIGWFHYDHEDMKASRDYGHPTDRPIVIGTLIHHHQLKGSVEALQAMESIKGKYGEKVHMVGIGEVPPGHKGFVKPLWMEYVYSPDRQGMANCLAQTDIWIGASHTEGLGRMALEAMSAGAACVLADTGAEFAKHGKNCLITPIGEPVAIVEAVDSLIVDEELKRQICIAAFRTAEEAADGEPCINALEAVIQGVMK